MAPKKDGFTVSYDGTPRNMVQDQFRLSQVWCDERRNANSSPPINLHTTTITSWADFRLLTIPRAVPLDDWALFHAFKKSQLIQEVTGDHEPDVEANGSLRAHRMPQGPPVLISCLGILFFVVVKGSFLVGEDLSAYVPWAWTTQRVAGHTITYGQMTVPEDVKASDFTAMELGFHFDGRDQGDVAFNKKIVIQVEKKNLIIT
ncbi:hypothetical protein N7488_003441 [Penicillium malachiteum]|nr:hypothetical protein N7488_003441 [Penicillium malachiteum]